MEEAGNWVCELMYSNATHRAIERRDDDEDDALSKHMHTHVLHKSVKKRLVTKIIICSLDSQVLVLPAPRHPITPWSQDRRRPGKQQEDKGKGAIVDCEREIEDLHF